MTAHVIPESMRRLWGIPAANDLPPLWDGAPVTWHGWTVTWSTIQFHLPIDQVACDQCGGIGNRGVNWGSRPAEQGFLTDPPAGTLIRDISAARCQDCGHDTVTCHRTNETWDLDPDDYGDAGSTETKDTLF